MTRAAAGERQPLGRIKISRVNRMKWIERVFGRRRRIVDMTAEEVAATIENFIEGRGGPWEWDDFLSFQITDPQLESIRERCNGLSEECPPGMGGGYCGLEGVDVMRVFVRELRERAAKQTAVPDGTGSRSVQSVPRACRR
ncbi:MAG: hypothetical protein R2712_05895 [Vicinamibacterales bacterium]